VPLEPRNYLLVSRAHHRSRPTRQFEDPPVNNSRELIIKKRETFLQNNNDSGNNNVDLILYDKYARALQRVERKILHLLIFATNSCV
jgi:hypothetical protein